VSPIPRYPVTILRERQAQIQMQEAEANAILHPAF
jgi:hypothetical protein